MAEPSRSASPSSLICKEGGLHLDDEEDDGNLLQKETAELCNEILDLEADDEYVQSLLSREGGRESSTRGSSPKRYCGDPARSDAIRWILETQRSFGFSLRTAYAAVSYFDQFFLHKTIDAVKDKSWAVKLLSVACLSLAAKMEECEVPALSEFRIQEYRFRSEAVQRMELFVLSTLGWRLLAVNPFHYLNYFASKFKEHGLKDLISKSIMFIFATIEAMHLVDFQPSTVAAAAILAAMDERSTQKLVESKMSLLSSCGSLDTEHVFSCYKLMIQASHKDKLKATKCLASTNTSPANCVSTTNTNCTVSVPMTSSKRRRFQ